MCEDTTSEEESAEEYERIAVLPSAEGVLQLHGVIGREDVLALSVPAGTPGRCCDCPDHCLRNYVALAGKPRRLSVCDAGNNDFGLSYEDTQVTVRGVYPSREPFGDAVHFVTNGMTSLSKSYTVLGVDFENITGPILSEYNAKSATFGLPVTVNTNLGSAASLCIRTDVLLENGIFRLALENCAGEFAIWAPERTYCDFSGNEPVLVTIPAEKLVDSTERTSRHFTVRQWRQMVSRHAGDGRGLNVLLLSSVTGRCDLAFSYALDHNGYAIRSSVRQRITSVMPVILPDYYGNVLHAFKTAEALANETKKLPGTRKTFIAHSLGNILTSAAIKDWNLEYSRYFMLNAAVAMEAYDAQAYEPTMIDPEWTNVVKYCQNYCASRWSKLFEQSHGGLDFRRSLSWKGRFAGIANAVNCYSTTEDVTGNIDTNKSLLGWTVWAKQERLKGSALWHVDAVLPGDVVCEGGWGVNSYYMFDDDHNEHGNIRYYNSGTGFTADMRRLSREDAIIHPLFTPFRAEAGAMHSTDLFTIDDENKRYALRARFLGDAIPAESFAMGANMVDKRNSGIDNLSMMEKCMANEKAWPDERLIKGKNGQPDVLKWYHSDWKQLAYCFVHKLFRQIVEWK